MSNLSLGEMIQAAISAGGILSASATITVTPSILLVSTLLIAANPLRKGLVIYNNGANSIYLTYGATSSSNTCTRILATFAQWEMMGPVIYTGAISGIRNAGAGTCVVTELT